jgi:hypothetical protein
MNTPPSSRWQRVLQQSAQQLNEHWPAPPATEQPSKTLQAGLTFSGQSHEIVPRQLLLDARLTPLERNAWQVLRLMVQDQGVVTPRYEDLQPYLSTAPFGASASRETIARVLTMLRLTRWLSLVSRGRDSGTGRLQASLYVLHDEPLMPVEAMELDPEYLHLVGQALDHGTKAVRIVAEHVVEEIHRDTRIDPSQLPTRLDNWGEQWVQQGLNLITEAPMPVCNASTNYRVRRRPGPDSPAERGVDARLCGSVRNPKAACTVVKESISTVPRATDAVDNLLWPAALHLSPSEHQSVAVALRKLKPVDRQAVLYEAGARCLAGGIRKPAAYVMGLIQRALNGDFHPWAAPIPPPSAADPPPMGSVKALGKHGKPASALAQACLNELRQLRNNRP